MKTYLILLFLLTGCATQKTNAPIIEHKEIASQSNLIDHKYFKISYDQKRRLARYVIYQLSAEQLSQKSASRADKFIADPILKSKNIPYVLPSEYVRSGYDRGHLAPSADFAWNQEANDMTFVMSNMAPQSKNLNRDAWRRLEEKVRKWACGEKLVTVITGPVLVDNLPRLASGLEIPQNFFKVIIDETPPTKAIAFLYNQEDKGDVLEERMIPVNSIEKMTGVAFNKEFPQMRDEKLRMPASLNQWKESDCSKISAE